MTDEKGTIKEGEFHPAARDALDYIQALPLEKFATWREAFASSAIAGNRLAEICNETMERISTGQPVSDRYVLGMAWTLKSGEYLTPTE